MSAGSWGWAWCLLWTPKRMLFTYSLMGWEAPGKMAVSSSVGHAWLRQCGLATVAWGALLSGCVWEYREPGSGWGDREGCRSSLLLHLLVTLPLRKWGVV